MPVTLVQVEDNERAPYVRHTAKGYEGARYWWVTTSNPGKAHMEAPLPQLGDPWDANFPTLIVSKVDIQYRVGPAVGAGGQDDAGRCLATVEYATPSDFGGGNDPPPLPGTFYTEHADPIVVSQTYYGGKTTVLSTKVGSTPPPDAKINNGDGVSVDLHLPQFAVTAIYLGIPDSVISKRMQLMSASYINANAITLPPYRGSAVSKQLESETARLTAASWEMSGVGNGGVSIYTLKATVAYSPPGPVPLPPKGIPGRWRVAWQPEGGSGVPLPDETWYTCPFLNTSWSGWI